jgi:hypothetical protein
LEADLRKLDDLYSLLPDEVKNTGLHKFADCPPEDTSFLVPRLWDTHLPAWRRLKAEKKEPHQSKHKGLMAEYTVRSDAFALGPDDCEYMMYEKLRALEKQKLRDTSDYYNFSSRMPTAYFKQKEFICETVQ